MAILSKVIITKSDVSKKSFKHTKYTISQKRSFWQSKVFIGQILTIFALGALTVKVIICCMYDLQRYGKENSLLSQSIQNYQK